MLRVKISTGGKVAIPIVYRKKLHLKDGDEIFFDLQDDHLIVSSLHNTLKKARSLIQQHCPSDISLVDELIVERRIEASHE